MIALLEAQALNSYYGDSHILFDVSLRVEKNEVVALLGRNGAGKSTILKIMAGLDKEWSGEAWKPLTDTPIVTHPHFTGTGTRSINENGKKAIEGLFTKSFE